VGRLRISTWTILKKGVDNPNCTLFPSNKMSVYEVGGLGAVYLLQKAVYQGRILLRRTHIVSDMTSDGDRSTILDDLASSVCPDPDVEYLVAFGSQVSGESSASSDLDIAVKFVDGLSDHERFKKWCFLSGNLQREDAPFVDVADIKRLPLDVAYDVVNGEFVCGDEAAFEQFKQEIEAGYSEHRETICREQYEVIDRIAEDGLSR